MKYGTHITIQGRFGEVAVHEVGTSQKLLKVVHAWGNSKVLVCVSVCVFIHSGSEMSVVHCVH